MDKVSDILEELFFKRFKIDLKKNEDLKEENIFGLVINAPVHEAVLLYDDIQKTFNILLPEEKIIEGKFDNFNHINKLVHQLYF